MSNRKINDVVLELKGGIMCLSKVYLEERKDGKLLLEEAGHVDFDGENVRVSSLFGENKELKGYYINEVNLMENYVILQRKEGA